MDSDTLDWLGLLVRPQPYMLFCDKLREFTSKEFEILVSNLFDSWAPTQKLAQQGQMKE